MNSKIGIIGSGVVGQTLANAYDRVIHAIPCDFERPQPDYCQQSSRSTPWVLAALGAAVLVIGAGVPSDPLTAEERDRLVREHDAAAPGATPAPRIAPGPKLRLDVAPAGAGDGGMLFLTGRF